jgi:hypothetical protein
MGIDREAVAYQIYLLQEDKFMVSSHVFFQEPPTPSSAPPLPPFLIQTLPKTTNDYQYLCGLLHVDDEDGIRYITTRISTLKGYIVAYRAIFSKKSTLKEINQVIHVKDIEKLTYKFYLKASNTDLQIDLLQPEVPKKRARNDANHHRNLENMVTTSPMIYETIKMIDTDPKSVTLKKVQPTRKCKHILSKLSDVRTESLKGKTTSNTSNQKSLSPFSSPPPESVFTSVSTEEDLNYFSLLKGGDTTGIVIDGEPQEIQKYVHLKEKNVGMSSISLPTLRLWDPSTFAKSS